MLTAREIMNPNPAFCRLDTPVEELSRRFAEEGTNGLLVLDGESRLMGVVTTSDLVDQQRGLHLPTAISILDMVIPLGEARFEEELRRMQAMTAEDLMTALPRTITLETTISEIASLMHEAHIHYLPVVGEEIEGVVSRHDLMLALTRKQAE